MTFDTRQKPVCQVFREILTHEDISMAELGRRIGCSTQAVSDKLKRESFTEATMLRYADAIGYNVVIQFIKRDPAAEQARNEV